MDVSLIYILNDDAGTDSFSIKGEVHRYLVKARRHDEGDVIHFRNTNDIKTLYKYEVSEVAPRYISFKLLSTSTHEVKSPKSLHVAWCVIDIHSIEKVLASLNEIGVDKISFIYCDRSQHKIKLDFKRFRRIVEASMQQCGRTNMMEFDSFKSIKDFIAKYGDVKVLDFCDNILSGDVEFQRVLIGCEGGFSESEKELFKAENIFRLDTPMVLRSESAAMAIASKILL